MRIILASASPRRQALLEGVGLDFLVMPADTPETMDENIPPPSLALENAERKAGSIACVIKTPALVIGADTIVVIDGKVLGKPRDEPDAISQLKRLSGRKHTVYTAVCLILAGGSAYKNTFVESSDVYMRPMAEREIAAYVQTGEPMDKAGSYALQGLGAAFITRVDGDRDTVIGLPLTRLLAEISDINCLTNFIGGS